MNTAFDKYRNFLKQQGDIIKIPREDLWELIEEADHIYCPVCGSCGEDGCCSPEKCIGGKHCLYQRE